MTEGELRTVHDDGTVTSEPLTHASARPLLTAWAAEQDAWEEYCARRRQEGNNG